MAFKDLRFLALQRKVGQDTPVWEKGNETLMRAAGEIPNLIPLGAHLPPEEKVEEEPQRYPEHARRRTIQDGPPGGLYLPYLKKSHFFLLPIFLFLSGILCYLAFQNSQKDLQMALFSFASFAALGWLVVSFIYLHRAWEMLRVVGADISGKRATLQMALPFVNSLLAFKIIYGWANLWNSLVQKHPGFSTTKKVSSFPHLLYCLGFLASHALIILHIIRGKWPINFSDPLTHITLATFALTFFLGFWVWSHFCHGINFLAKKKA